MPGRLLLVSYSYPPIADVGSLRTIKFAKYLVRLGWAVHVLSVSNPDVWRMIGPAETPSGVEVTRTWDPVRMDRFGTAIRKVIVSRGEPSIQARAGLGTRGVVVPDFQAGWVPTAARAAIRLARRWGATHLMGTGPPYSSLIAAAVAQRRTGLPMIADFQDSWTIHPDTRYPTQAHRALDEDLERLVWERASVVSVMTQTVAGRYAERYPDWASKLRVVYNGFDPEDFPSTNPQREGPFTIAYTGSFYPHTPPSTLLAALQSLRAEGVADSGNLRVEFLGRPEEAVHAEVVRRDLTDIVYEKGFRPYREAVEAASGADLLYLLIPSHFGEALADKLFVYLATGNPILAEVPTGECRRLLEDWGDRVFYVPPGAVDSMVAALRSVLEEGRRPASASARREAFRQTFDRASQARELARILEGLT